MFKRHVTNFPYIDQQRIHSGPDSPSRKRTDDPVEFPGAPLGQAQTQTFDSLSLLFE